jgi:hypothetical protein
MAFTAFAAAVEAASIQRTIIVDVLSSRCLVA